MRGRFPNGTVCDCGPKLKINKSSSVKKKLFGLKSQKNLKVEKVRNNFRLHSKLDTEVLSDLLKSL